MLISLDPSTLLPGLFSPSGRRRKILVVLAHSALMYYLKTGADVRDLLEEGLGGDARLGGRSLDDLIADVAARQAHLEEFIPPLTPDLELAVSVPLLKELERKAADPRWGKHLPQGVDRPTYARRQILAIASTVVGVDTEHLPSYTRDRKDDYVVQTALSAGAAFLVSDDKDIAPSAEKTKSYVDPSTGRRVDAIQFGPFVENEVNSSNFDLDDVDGFDLPRAHALLSALRG